MSATLQQNGFVHLASLISTERIVPQMVSRDRRSAITELVDHMDATGLLPRCGREEVLEALHSREEFISTGIGSGVAIPHTFSDHIDEVIAVMGKSREGIDFSAHDDAPVHLVILFVVPRRHYDLHLRTLAAIARLFHHDELKHQLIEAGSADEILCTLKSGAPRSIPA